MKVLIAAYYELLKNLRDIRMHVVFIVFPVITILILGTVIQSAFSNDIARKISVGYVNEDKGMTGAGFDKFINSEDISKRFEISDYIDYKEGQKALEEGIIENLIYLPNALSENIKLGEKAAIKLYGKKNTEFVEDVINSYSFAQNTFTAVINTSGNSNIQNSGVNSLNRIYYGRNSQPPKAIDYYSVLTMLQMLIVGALFGIFIVTRNYGSDIHIRFHTLPVGRWSIIGGKTIGSIIYLVLTAGITIILTKILYNADWNGNSIVIFGTITIFCSITVGIGLLIGIFVKNFSTSFVIVILLSLFFGSFSGSISPESTNNTVSFLIPNYHAKVLLFGTVNGYSKVVMREAACWLTVMLVTVYGIAAIALRRSNYDNI